MDGVSLWRVSVGQLAIAQSDIDVVVERGYSSIFLFKPLTLQDLFHVCYPATLLAAIVGFTGSRP